MGAMGSLRICHAETAESSVPRQARFPWKTKWARDVKWARNPGTEFGGEMGPPTVGGPFTPPNSVPRFRAHLTSPKPRAWIQRLSRSRDGEKAPLLSEISWHHLGMGDGLTCSGIAHMDKKYTWPAKGRQWQGIAKLPLSDLSDSAQSFARCHTK